MTRQEPHTCDVCGEIYFVPQEKLQTLEINRGMDDEVSFDLCFDCKKSLMDWIRKRREASPTESP